MRFSTSLTTTSFFGIVLASTALTQTTMRVSVNSAGAQGNNDSGVLGLAISGDGRYVAFYSNSTNLVPGDTNGWLDVFVRDRQLGTTERVSVSSGGAQGNDSSYFCSISPDARYVAFGSRANTLVPGDTGVIEDIFVRDRQLGTTERVSISSGGAQADDSCFYTSISADGRYVAFVSRATNLVPGDTNGFYDVFVHDRQLGTTERVSESSGGAQGNADSGDAAYFLQTPSISADGRYVAFVSRATNLVPGDTIPAFDILVRDRQLGTTERISESSGGAEANGFSGYPSISADGRYVAFGSGATNLVPGDTNGCGDIFLRDRQLGTTQRISVSSGGGEANGGDGYPSISADGRYVAFGSWASNLVPGDTNSAFDVFVRDLQLGTTERASIHSGGAEGNGDSADSGGYNAPVISGDGRYVAYWTFASNLIPGDTNGVVDVFVRDRTGGTNFTSLCDPGVGGVMGCPCSNAPSGLGRGCNNSAATGGAVLSASGGAYLSSDSLVFTTSGEKPTATSVLLQGTTLAASGVVYGQGVRCAGGALKRLFTKNAVGGSITTPNFGAGDPTVSARSLAKGNLISAGQSRWYLVFYRDPVVLGGCPAGSTFNATQTGRIIWMP